MLSIFFSHHWNSFWQDDIQNRSARCPQYSTCFQYLAKPPVIWNSRHLVHLPFQALSSTQFDSLEDTSAKVSNIRHVLMLMCSVFFSRYRTVLPFFSCCGADMTCIQTASTATSITISFDTNGDRLRCQSPPCPAS